MNYNKTIITDDTKDNTERKDVRCKNKKKQKRNYKLSLTQKNELNKC